MDVFKIQRPAKPARYEIIDYRFFETDRTLDTVASAGFPTRPADPALSSLYDSAIRGNGHAMCSLAQKYSSRFSAGSHVDDRLAAMWFQKGSENGDALASYNLAVMYEEGQGVARDHTRAYQLLREAAKRGHMLSKIRLEEIHRNDESPF